ncbi:MAG TPA: acyl-CoA dehydrogenase family protein [Thermoanaerobaculia bacterium]|nr:acyl-CoA dehydrogenase family protein [Thermoanaerobaculia bacterium]
MDFRPTAEQKSLQEEMAALAARLPDTAAGDQFPAQSWRLCGEARLHGLPVPREHGGREADLLTTALALEAFAAACRDEGLAFSVCAHMQTCALPIARFGSNEQKRQYLPDLCCGALVGGNATTEPEAGSDAFSMQTTAVRDGEGYRLQGHKCFVTNGPVADLLVVYAVTNPKYRQFGGISVFLVETSREGVHRGAPMDKIGLRTAPWCDVRLDCCWVPAAHRLGEEGAGTEIFSRAMEWERLLIPMIAVGRMADTLERCLEHCRVRHQFGRPLGKHQAVAQKLVDMKVDLEISRLLLYRAAWLQDQGEKALLETALGKLVATESRLRSCLNAIQVHGARGCIPDFGIERELRNAVPGTISSGTSEVQRMIIARFLGL